MPFFTASKRNSSTNTKNITTKLLRAELLGMGQVQHLVLDVGGYIRNKFGFLLNINLIITSTKLIYIYF
jgi:hypothetical protein